MNNRSHYNWCILVPYLATADGIFCVLLTSYSTSLSFRVQCCYPCTFLHSTLGISSWKEERGRKLCVSCCSRRLAHHRGHLLYIMLWVPEIFYNTVSRVWGEDQINVPQAAPTVRVQVQGFHYPYWWFSNWAHGSTVALVFWLGPGFTNGQGWSRQGQSSVVRATWLRNPRLYLSRPRSPTGGSPTSGRHPSAISASAPWLRHGRLVPVP